MKLPKVGKVWTPLYPVRNFLHIPLEYLERRILVEQVLDFSRSGLSIDEFLERPLLRRGSILVIGKDLDLGQRRKLYFDATPEHDLPLLKLGVVNSDAALLGWLGRPYEPTCFDREELAAEVRHWQERFAGTELRLGVFTERAA